MKEEGDRVAGAMQNKSSPRKDSLHQFIVTAP